MTDKLSPPFGICDACFCHQGHQAYDIEGLVYFCAHNNCLAIRKPNNSGWQIETGVSADEWLRKCADAEAVLDLLGAGLKQKH